MVNHHFSFDSKRPYILGLFSDTGSQDVSGIKGVWIIAGIRVPDNAGICQLVLEKCLEMIQKKSHSKDCHNKKSELFNEPCLSMFGVSWLSQITSSKHRWCQQSQSGCENCQCFRDDPSWDGSQGPRSLIWLRIFHETCLLLLLILTNDNMLLLSSLYCYIFYIFI